MPLLFRRAAAVRPVYRPVAAPAELVIPRLPRLPRGTRGVEGLVELLRSRRIVFPLATGRRAAGISVQPLKPPAVRPPVMPPRPPRKRAERPPEKPEAVPRPVIAPAQTQETAAPTQKQRTIQPTPPPGKKEEKPQPLPRPERKALHPPPGARKEKRETGEEAPSSVASLADPLSALRVLAQKERILYGKRGAIGITLLVGPTPEQHQKLLSILKKRYPKIYGQVATLIRSKYEQYAEAAARLARMMQALNNELESLVGNLSRLTPEAIREKTEEIARQFQALTELYKKIAGDYFSANYGLKLDDIMRKLEYPRNPWKPEIPAELLTRYPESAGILLAVLASGFPEQVERFLSLFDRLDDLLRQLFTEISGKPGLSEYKERLEAIRGLVERIRSEANNLIKHLFNIKRKYIVGPLWLAHVKAVTPFERLADKLRQILKHIDTYVSVLEQGLIPDTKENLRALMESLPSAYMFRAIVDKIAKILKEPLEKGDEAAEEILRHAIELQRKWNQSLLELLKTDPETPRTCGLLHGERPIDNALYELVQVTAWQASRPYEAMPPIKDEKRLFSLRKKIAREILSTLDDIVPAYVRWCLTGEPGLFENFYQKTKRITDSYGTPSTVYFFNLNNRTLFRDVYDVGMILTEISKQTGVPPWKLLKDAGVTIRDLIVNPSVRLKFWKRYMGETSIPETVARGFITSVASRAARMVREGLDSIVDFSIHKIMKNVYDRIGPLSKSIREEDIDAVREALRHVYLARTRGEISGVVDLRNYLTGRGRSLLERIERLLLSVIEKEKQRLIAEARRIDDLWSSERIFRLVQAGILDAFEKYLRAGYGWYWAPAHEQQLPLSWRGQYWIPDVKQMRRFISEKLKPLVYESVHEIFAGEYPDWFARKIAEIAQKLVSPPIKMVGSGMVGVYASPLVLPLALQHRLTEKR